ncbi:MAG: hypothetical protein QHC90_07560 [Shinella sp.]|nr:hypothetical protein [Shinella sp.]
MRMTREFRVAAGIMGLLGASLTLSGCLGAPTYGTDKTATEQLLSDVGNAVMLSPGNEEAKRIKYQPRGGLVLPKDESKLVQPQQSVASAANPEWVESPEEIRDRLRREADENARSATYQSPLQRSNAYGQKLSTQQQLEQYREARRLQQGLYTDQRRYLSDPPLDYRRLPEGAEADLGESERDKERRRKKAAEMETGRRWWPF